MEMITSLHYDLGLSKQEQTRFEPSAKKKIEIQKWE